MLTYARMLVSAVVLGLLLSGSTALAELPTKPVLTLEAAKKLAAAAEEEAVKNKWNMVIAIVDDGGSLVYLQRLDGTQIGSIDVALHKARTAVHFKRPTKALEDAVTGGRTVVLALGAMPIEGGIPLMVDDKLIGAIGVSGAAAQQDGQVAKAGADALPKVLGK